MKKSLHRIQRVVALWVLFGVCCWLPVAAQAQEPFLSATIGTGSNTSYFVLDFKNGPEPQSYAFAYRWDGAQTGGVMLDALAANVPTFSFTAQSFGSFGRFVTGLGYDGKFQDNSPPNTLAFWSYWVSTDGINWSDPGAGLDSRVLTNGSWDGWAWGPDFNNFPGPPPVTPFAAAAAPEPASFLLILGVFCPVGIQKIRKKRANR
ncbi:MAG: hypothetical protein OHK0029_03540 [Armatimonadaceae bacterium]